MESKSTSQNQTPQPAPGLAIEAAPQVNQTIHKRVVVLRPDLNPVPDRILVIFERVGTGLRFRDVLQPNRGFIRRSPTAFFREHVAYAVDTDANLQLEFQFTVTLRDQIHSVELTFYVDYRVGDARLITEKLEADPLSRLQDRIQRLIGAAISATPWIEIKENFQEVESRILDEQSVPAARIREFAESVGIGVERMSVSYRLLDKDTEILRALEQARIDEVKRTIAQEAEDAKKQQERKHKAMDNVVDSVNSAIEKLAGTIENPEEFRRTAATIVEAVQGFGNTILEDSARSRAEPSVATGFRPKLLNPVGGVEDMLHATIDRVAGSGSRPNDKRQLLAAILSLYAECLLGNAADVARLGHSADRVDEMLERLAENFAEDDLEELRALCRPSRIRDAAA
jgi:AcrR family transcriptional regulator